MNNVFIRATEDLPMKQHGIVAMDANGDYIVVINAKLSPEKQQEALEHELSHIHCGDLAQRHRVPAHIIEAQRRKT